MRALAGGIAAVLGATAAAASETDAAAGIHAAREAAGKWVQTQKLIYQERKDWQQEKELILARIELLEKEIAETEARLDETRRTASEGRSRKAEALAGRDALVRDAEQLADLLAGYEQDVRRLHPLLPPPIQEKIAALYQRMPEDPSTTKVSVAERFQNVLGIMNEIGKANGEVTLATEIRTLSDGKPSEVKTIYLGLAQAYYMSGRGEAGVGRPGADGWVFTPDDRLGADILHAVEIMEGKAPPKFVGLPVKIQ
jgi:hypothetical protein